LLHPKALRFLARHRWSIPLGVLSSAFFAKLASELRARQLDAVDDTVAAFVVSLRGRCDGLMIFLTEVGRGWTLTVITTLAITAMLHVRRQREALFLLFSCGGAGLLNIGLKLFFQRARPVSGVEYLVPTPSSFSFPSGHAMGSAAVFASLVIVLQVVRAPHALQIGGAIAAFVLALSIGVSRIYLGVHFPSDVLGGQLAAAAWVSAMTGWFYPRLLPGEAAEAELPEHLPE
jgi:undecaprenyl-diphosphatase